VDRPVIIHLTWMTPVWVLAVIGALFVLYIIIAFIIVLLFWGD